MTGGPLGTRSAIEKAVRGAVEKTPVLDVHTHLYPPSFGPILLWGIDELVTYHYLIAESVRAAGIQPERFRAMPKAAQAEFVWENLFLRHSPISEACRGVLTALRRLGIDARKRDLAAIRRHFLGRTVAAHVDDVFRIAGVSKAVMTNDPFDDEERPSWLAGKAGDPRFLAVLRMDPILNGWPAPVKAMRASGYRVGPRLDARCLGEVRRFLGDWIGRMKAIYMAVSLPPTFAFPEKSDRAALIERAVMPVARERGIPFAVMVGVKKRLNPRLGLAGDGVGRAGTEALESLCLAFPENRLLASYLSREDQHGLCVAARKLPNLLIFGCWWFLNNPSIIEEITRERLELLGPSFVPQHSDARVLDQLLYKWDHFRAIFARVLADKYADLAAAGSPPTAPEIRRDVQHWFSGAFEGFLAGTPGNVRIDPGARRG